MTMQQQEDSSTPAIWVCSDGTTVWVFQTEITALRFAVREEIPLKVTMAHFGRPVGLRPTLPRIPGTTPRVRELGISGISGTTHPYAEPNDGLPNTGRGTF